MKSLKIISLIIVIAISTASCGLIKNELGLNDAPAIKFNEHSISIKDLDADFQALVDNEELVSLMSDSPQPFVTEDGELAEDLKLQWANLKLGSLVYRDARLDADMDITDEDLEEAEEQNSNTFFGQPQQSKEVWEAFPEDFRERLNESVAERIAFLRTADPVTDEEARAHFEENAETYTTCESGLTSRHILVETEEEANEVRQSLVDGEDFNELAKEKSIDPGVKENSGEYGCFEQGGGFIEEYEQAVLNTPVGEFSQPVQSQFGYHIIQPQEFVTPTFEDVKDQIKEDLKPAKEEALFEKLDERMKEGEVFVDEKYGKIVEQDGIPMIVALDYEEQEQPQDSQMPQELTEEQLQELQEFQEQQPTTT